MPSGTLLRTAVTTKLGGWTRHVGHENDATAVDNR